MIGIVLAWSATWRGGRRVLEKAIQPLKESHPRDDLTKGRRQERAAHNIEPFANFVSDFHKPVVNPFGHASGPADLLRVLDLQPTGETEQARSFDRAIHGYAANGIGPKPGVLLIGALSYGLATNSNRSAGFVAAHCRRAGSKARKQDSARRTLCDRATF